MSPSIHEAEWTQLIVPDSGRKYFYNVTTGESRWDIRNQGGPYSQGGPYNAKHKGGPQFKSNTRPMHPSMQIADSGPYFVSNKPMHPMANGTRPKNRHYHTLNDAIDYTHHQQRARPQPYEFMTPPRERRSRSQILSPQGHSDPFQRQLNQLILKPPHQRDPVARNHRKSHSVSNIISDISTESLKRELIDAYHKQISTDPGHSNQRKNRANNAPVNDSHMVNLLQSMELEKTEKYTKDYVGLSKAYKLMETYRLNHRGTCPACLFCNKARRLDKVLFPCEHVCVCSSCLETTEPKRCPLCKDVIRRVLDCNGHEHDDYWRWVEEVKPVLSTKFLQQFFAESKNAIKTEMARRRSPTKNNDFDVVEGDQQPKPQMQRHGGSSIFSCWQRLLGRRVSCAEDSDRPQSYSYL